MPGVHLLTGPLQTRVHTQALPLEDPGQIERQYHSGSSLEFMGQQEGVAAYTEKPFTQIIGIHNGGGCLHKRWVLT